MDLLDAEAAIDHWKASGLDLSPILHLPELAEGAARHNTTTQDHGLDRALDRWLIEGARPALDDGQRLLVDGPPAVQVSVTSSEG